MWLFRWGGCPSESGIFNLTKPVENSDPTEQRPHIDEMDYGFDINPEMQLSSGSFAGDGVDGGIDAIPLPGVHNGEQAETPRQPGAGYEFMNNGQDPPVPMPPPSTNMQVDAISDDNTIRYVMHYTRCTYAY